jgi:hypothetical protein
LKPPFLSEGERGWFCQLPDRVPPGDDAQALERSPLMLFEDGRPLWPAHCSHEDVRTLGRGRFSHWLNTLYFSTPTKSDPNTNGHTYTVLFENPTQQSELERTTQELQGTRAELDRVRQALAATQKNLTEIQAGCYGMRTRLLYDTGLWKGFRRLVRLLRHFGYGKS